MSGVVTQLRPRDAQQPIIAATSMREAVDNLLRNGWTRFEYSGLARRYEQVIASFIAMTNDPEKSDYMITDPREMDSDGDPDLGLIFKDRGQKKMRPRPDEVAENRLHYDASKYLHHYNPRLLAYLGKKPNVIQRHADFFLESGRMHSEAALLMTEVSEELDRRMSGYGFAERVRLSDWSNRTRLLHYLCDGPAEIAIRHRDKCFLTIHIRSSRSGLWIVDKHDNIIADPEETRSNSVLMFLGRKAWEISKGYLPGIIHGVTDTLADDLLRRSPRQTAVFFGHAHVTPEEQAWGLDHTNDLKIPEHVERHAAGK